jgi:cyanate lyase
MLITGAVLGQWKLTKPQVANAAELFGLSKTEQALLNEVPHRGSPMPPTDPLIYRLYELVMVNRRHDAVTELLLDQHFQGRAAADLGANMFPAPAVFALDAEQLFGEFGSCHCRCH